MNHSTISFRAEYVVSAALTVAAVAMHTVFFAHAGTPWRDEVNSVAIASLASWGAMWDALRFDSFPILYFACLRTWIGAFGDSTASLRALGLGIGFGLLGSLWWLSRVVRLGAPLLMMAMVGLSAAFIRYGDSVRAYGLGLIGVTLLMGALWSLLSECSKKTVALALAASLVAVHSTYQNSLLLAALGSAAAISLAVCRQWRNTWAIVAIGAVSAASMFIYLPEINATRSMLVVFRTPILARDIAAEFGGTVATGYADWQIWIWTLVALMATFSVVRALRPDTGPQSPRAANNRDVRALFLLLAVPALVGTYLAFFIWSELVIRPWYLLAPMLVLTGLAEMAIAIYFWPPIAARTLRIFLALLVGSVAIVNAPADLSKKATNMPDVVAAIEKDGRPGDLVVLTDWTRGVTFNHLYRGQSAWITVPNLGHHSIHRTDLLKARMQDENGVSPELATIEQILNSGHRVYVVGQIPTLASVNWRQPLPPAPGPQGRWSYGDYGPYWAAQTGTLLSLSSNRAITLLSRSAPSSVMYWENAPVTRFEQVR